MGINGRRRYTLSLSAMPSNYRPEKNFEDVVVKTRQRIQDVMISSHGPALGVNVKEEKQDESSPEGVIDAFHDGLESNKTTQDTRPKGVTGRVGSGALANWKKLFKLWKTRSKKRLASIPILSSSKWSIKFGRSAKENPMMREIYNFKSSLQNFSLPELRAATDNFNPENIIGRGGYSVVYKGCLKDGKFVAIKRATNGTYDERTASFLSELGILAHVNHPNTATLIGCGVEGGMHLVFQLSRLGSLASVLHADLSSRFAISALQSGYRDSGHTTTYLAPEYFMHGVVDEKTDVYAFGVLLLELITGRRALDQQQSIVVWAKPLLDKNDIKELIDPSLGNDYDVKEVDRMVSTASLCINHASFLRPQMNQVIKQLRDNEYVAHCSKKSRSLSVRRTYSNEIFDAQEYNLTKQLNMNRLREIALSS
ncbi:hypothetical protein V6N11_037853 [Hibiscus sabdariffa]|uniref:Protein kinase domain-containing protein n=2 Tax=Hibiscus sabdariffa TaxID=183260 RepID=A0ABR2A6F0_9ROSI